MIVEELGLCAAVLGLMTLMLLQKATAAPMHKHIIGCGSCVSHIPINSL